MTDLDRVTDLFGKWAAEEDPARGQDALPRTRGVSVNGPEPGSREWHRLITASKAAAILHPLTTIIELAAAA